MASTGRRTSPSGWKTPTWAPSGDPANSAAGASAGASSANNNSVTEAAARFPNIMLAPPSEASDLSQYVQPDTTGGSKKPPKVSTDALAVGPNGNRTSSR